jgi:hypothetical protein
VGDVATERMNVTRGRVDKNLSDTEASAEGARAQSEALQRTAEAVASKAKGESRAPSGGVDLPRPVAGVSDARRQRYRLSSLSPAQHDARAQKVAVEEAGLPGESLEHHDPTAPTGRRRGPDLVPQKQDPGRQWGEDLPDQADRGTELMEHRGSAQPRVGGPMSREQLLEQYDTRGQPVKSGAGDVQAYKPEKRRYRMVGATTGRGAPGDGDALTPGEVKV